MIDNYNIEYARVTARDIADLLHHLAELRSGPRGNDAAERTTFTHRKAEMFTRITDQAARIRTDAHSEQVRQIAADAHAAADTTDPQLPQQRVGPNQRRTPDHPPTQDGAKSQQKTGASPG